MSVTERARDERQQKKRGGRRGHQAERAARVPFGQMEFVDVKLNPLELDAFDREQLSPAELVSGVSGLVAVGYKFSCTRDFEHDCFICTLTMADAEHENAGLVLVTRGATFEDSIGLSLFKHFTVLQEDWRGAQKASPVRMRG